MDRQKSFEEQVYDLVGEIPRGRVSTYGQLDVYKRQSQFWVPAVFLKSLVTLPHFLSTLTQYLSLIHIYVAGWYCWSL